MLHLPYDTVIFDLDGTLCEAEKGIGATIRYTLEQLGFPPISDENCRLMVGPPLMDGFIHCAGLTEEEATRATAFYREHFPTVGIPVYSVFPGIRRLLSALRQQGIFIAVATSKSQELGAEVLKLFGLYGAVDRVVGETTGDTPRLGKAKLIRKALPREDCHPVMVGDRLYDMQGAKNAGIDAIGVLYGCGSREELEQSGADAVVSSPGELQDLLAPHAKAERGFFLSMEGPDGCGKTTQMRLLRQKLEQFGFDVVLTREPGGCPVAEKIRQVILDPANTEMTDLCEAMLYAASRAQHVQQVIAPAVAAGKLVLSDRFVDSSVAYQGGGRGLGVELVEEINRPAVEGMLPNATVYLEMDAKTALGRRLSVSDPDRLEGESLSFHERVVQAYERRMAAQPERFLRIDATRSVEEVARDVAKAVLHRLLPGEPAEEFA